MDTTTPTFPADLLLEDSDRSSGLLQWYYEEHHKNRDYEGAKDDHKKLDFFEAELQKMGKKVSRGVDLGCRGGALTQQLQDYGNWVGCDIDTVAIEKAQSKGIPCIQMNFSVSIGLVDDSFDGVILTEVLEHLPYPLVTVKEVHRIMKKDPDSVFMGTVPIDYHFHRRYSVFRGGRLHFDPTHLHSFSLPELRAIMDIFFEDVTYEPMRGTARRHRWLPWDHFVRDVAWFARSPRQSVGEIPIKVFK